MKCFICGGKIKVSLKGGEFLIREGSTPDNINYERIVKLIGVPEKIDEDIMFDITIECVADPSHNIFDHTDAAIRYNIYSRIASAAMKLVQKYYGNYNDTSS